jgi:hypothetical protein
MKKIIYYLPRVLSLALVLFFGVFILEGLGEGFGWQDSLTHLFSTLVILGLTIVAWKRPRLGGWIFIALGLLFGLGWGNLWLGGIAALTGILFFISQKKP